MLTTPHLLTGMAIYHLSPGFLSLFLSFISHYILDFFLPHWNPHLYSEFRKNKKLSDSSKVIILVDSLLAFFLFSLTLKKNIFNFSSFLGYSLAGFLAILPDAVEIPYYFFAKKPKKLLSYINFMHRYQAEAGIFWGLISQILVSLSALKVLFLTDSF